MSAAKKQKLDLFSFDADATADEEAVSEEQLQAARDEAFAAGREAALAEHLATEERRLGDMIEKLLADATALTGTVDRMSGELAAEALDIAMLAVRKVLPTLTQTNGISEIEGLVKNCLAELTAEPRVAIRLNAATLEEIKRRLERIAGATGYDGKLVLLADDDLAPTDCEILWADGGATRDVAAVTATIEAAVDRFLSPGEPASPDVPPQPATAAPAEEVAAAAPADAAPADPAPAGDPTPQVGQPDGAPPNHPS